MSSDHSSEHLQTLLPGSGEALARTLAELTDRGRQVVLQGHGSRASLGALIDSEHCTLSTAALNSVVHYEPGDLTVTVGAGMALSSLADLLAENGQQLPLQGLRRRGTVGGLVASAADGALTLGYGSTRDQIIGATIAYGDGSLATARGRVVKNVAGYDLPRLMVGSLGTLGALTEVSFKLFPLAQVSVTVVSDFAHWNPAWRAARQLADKPWEPVFVDLLSGASGSRLVVGFDGSHERVTGLSRACSEWLASAAGDGLQVLRGEQDRTLRTALDDPLAPGRTEAGRTQEQAGPSLADGETLRQGRDDVVLRWWGHPARVQPALELLLAPRDDGLILRVDARPLLGQVFVGLSHEHDEALRAGTVSLLDALRRSGSTVLLQAPASLRGNAARVWGPPPAEFELMRQLKQALDPDGTFAPGRFVGGL